MILVKSEENESAYITLYTNPSSGEIVIRNLDITLKEYTLIVIDITGRVILKRQETMSGEYSMDLSKLAKGDYLFTLMDSEAGQLKLNRHFILN